MEAAESELRNGASRVVLGTVALVDPGLVGGLVAKHGAERVAVAIDVRAGLAVGHGWADGEAGLEAIAAIERLAGEGISTFEVTAIERDGLLEGPDLSLYERLVRAGLGSIIASGGVTTLDDLHRLRDLGCAGAILGRAVYEGRLDLASAIGLSGVDQLG